MPNEVKVTSVPATAEVKPKMKQRVAVIAVHGVGHAEPGGTARHIADLLLGLGRLQLPPRNPGDVPIQWSKGDPPYPGFKTQAIQVPLRVAPITNRKTAMQRTVDIADAQESSPTSDAAKLRSTLRHFWHFLDERRGYIAGI
jgi:hypothetical protein